MTRMTVPRNHQDREVRPMRPQIVIRREREGRGGRKREGRENELAEASKSREPASKEKPGKEVG